MVWYVQLNSSDTVETPLVEDTLLPESSSTMLQTSPTKINSFEYEEIIDNNSILNNLQASNLSPPIVVNQRNNLDLCLMKELFETVLTRVDNLEVVNASLTNEVIELKSTVSSLNEKLKLAEKEHKSLVKNLFSIDKRLIRNEQYVNRESLIISGIPERITQKNLEKEVIKILHTIGLNDVSHYEIAACHRLNNRSERFPARTIVRFTNRKITDFCLKNKKRLVDLKAKINMNLRFYECLCPANEEILRNCIDLKKYGIIYHYYTRNGFVKIVINENDMPIKIGHPNELKELFKDFFLAEQLYQQ